MENTDGRWRQGGWVRSMDGIGGEHWKGGCRTQLVGGEQGGWVDDTGRE